MFIVVDRRRYRWPVTVRVPSPGMPGEIEEQRFVAHFLAPHRDEAVAELDAITALPVREAEEKLLEGMLAKVVGWEEVVDADGIPVAFSEEILRRSAQEPWFRAAIDAAYRESLTGEAARLGN